MEEAPTIIFVVNSLGKGILSELTPEEYIYEIYFAYSEPCEWLKSDGQLIAAIAFGYPNEFPKERPRKKLDDIVQWRN